MNLKSLALAMAIAVGATAAPLIESRPASGAERWVRAGLCAGIGVRMCLMDRRGNFIQCVCVPGRF
jgi:hypothetical protein